MAITSTTPTLSDHLTEPELRAWRGLLRSHAAITKELDAELEAAHGLALSSYEVLLFLNDADEGRMRMSDLADSVLLSRSGLTRLVDRMERDGLLTRESCPSDARGSYARLSDTGREHLVVARRTHLDGVRRRFLAQLTPEELDVLGEALERIVPPGATKCPSAC